MRAWKKTRTAKAALLLNIVSLLLLSSAFSGDGSGRTASTAFRSSDDGLQKAFDWAKQQALNYAFEDDPVGAWYEAALPGREAFCMRDVSHQSMGAHALGLSRHTKNMLLKFAENISESRDWCSYWEINRYGLPAPVDYANDVRFWYNLPANFDVLDCCYRMFLWTGDRAYVEHPTFLSFYERTVHDYVDRWDLSLDRIMTRRRIMNTRGRLDPEDRFQTNRGIPSYDESGTDFVVALDQLAAQYAGYLAYGRIQRHRGNAEEAEKFLSKASAMRSFVDREWWDEEKRRYYSHLDAERNLVYRGSNQAVLYYGATQDGAKISEVLDAIEASIASMGVESLSHVPEILYRYGRAKAAYTVLLDLTRHDRREYPEVSFAVVGAVVTGLMGIELEVHPPDEALVWGGYVDRFLTTIPRLGETTDWAEIENLSLRANTIAVRHEGSTKTTLTNSRGPSFLWKARFLGSHRNLVVHGEPVQAAKGELYAGGPKLSWVRVTVGAGETITVQTPE